MEHIVGKALNKVLKVFIKNFSPEKLVNWELHDIGLLPFFLLHPLSEISEDVVQYILSIPPNICVTSVKVDHVKVKVGHVLNSFFHAHPRLLSNGSSTSPWSFQSIPSKLFLRNQITFLLLLFLSPRKSLRTRSSRALFWIRSWMAFPSSSTNST